MFWAVIYHPQQIVNGRLVLPPRQIAEACLPVAIVQGWIVLARDSDMVSSAPRVFNPPNLVTGRKKYDVETNEWR